MGEKDISSDFNASDLNRNNEAFQRLQIVLIL